MANAILPATPQSITGTYLSLFRVQSVLRMMAEYSEHALNDRHLNIRHGCELALNEVQSVLGLLGEFEKREFSAESTKKTD